MSRISDERARQAENSQKVFNDKTKVILFLITVGVGVVTIWDKCSSSTHQAIVLSDSAKRHTSDSITASHRIAAVTNPHKRHPKPVKQEMEGDGPATDAPASSGDRGGPTTKNVPPPVVAPHVARPVQTTEAEDIEFKLLSAEGSSRAQTIRMTVVLTNHAANRFIWSDVQSISDPDGNEYMLKSFTNGASSYDIHIPLDTEVPRKCTYTFGGVLPSVKTIRLFKFLYRHKSLDDPNWVDFRDVPIDWR